MLKRLQCAGVYVPVFVGPRRVDILLKEEAGMDNILSEIEVDNLLHTVVHDKS